MALKCTGRGKKSPFRKNGGPGDPPKAMDSVYVKADEASQIHGVMEDGMYPIDLKGINLDNEGMVQEVGKHDRSLGLGKDGVIKIGGGGYEINANQDLPEPVKKWKTSNKP